MAPNIVSTAQIPLHKLIKIMKIKVEQENRRYFFRKAVISMAQTLARTRLKENPNNPMASRAVRFREIKFLLGKTWTNLLILRSIKEIILKWIKLLAQLIRIIKRHRSLQILKNSGRVIKVKWLRLHKITIKRAARRVEIVHQASIELDIDHPTQNLKKE